MGRVKIYNVKQIKTEMAEGTPKLCRNQKSLTQTVSSDDNDDDADKNDNDRHHHHHHHVPFISVAFAGQCNPNSETEFCCSKVPFSFH